MIIADQDQLIGIGGVTVDTLPITGDMSTEELFMMNDFDVKEDLEDLEVLKDIVKRDSEQRVEIDLGKRLLLCGKERWPYIIYEINITYFYLFSVRNYLALNAEW